jgi:hypothetical protein
MPQSQRRLPHAVLALLQWLIPHKHTPGVRHALRARDEVVGSGPSCLPFAKMRGRWYHSPQPRQKDAEATPHNHSMTRLPHEFPAVLQPLLQRMLCCNTHTYHTKDIMMNSTRDKQ